MINRVNHSNKKCDLGHAFYLNLERKFNKMDSLSAFMLINDGERKKYSHAVAQHIAYFQNLQRHIPMNSGVGRFINDGIQQYISLINFDSATKKSHFMFNEAGSRWQLSQLRHQQRYAKNFVVNCFLAYQASKGNATFRSVVPNRSVKSLFNQPKIDRLKALPIELRNQLHLLLQETNLR